MASNVSLCEGIPPGLFALDYGLSSFVKALGDGQSLRCDLLQSFEVIFALRYPARDMTFGWAILGLLGYTFMAFTF